MVEKARRCLLEVLFFFLTILLIHHHFVHICVLADRDLLDIVCEAFGVLLLFIYVLFDDAEEKLLVRLLAEEEYFVAL